MWNRFTTIWVPEIDFDEQRTILLATYEPRGVPPVVVDAIADLAEWTRVGYASGALGAAMRERDQPVISIRALSKALDIACELGPELGWEAAYLLAAEAIFASTTDASDNEAIFEKAHEVAR
jgi:hypothetical protein